MTNVANQIACLLQAMANCRQSGNTDWESRHEDALRWIAKNRLPRGSGFDCGTQIAETSTPDRLVLTTEFHHMDCNGSYDGWSSHTVICQPSLVHGFTLRVTGRDRNEIKDYIADTFNSALRNEFTDADKRAMYGLQPVEA